MWENLCKFPFSMIFVSIINPDDYPNVVVFAVVTSKEILSLRGKARKSQLKALSEMRTTYIRFSIKDTKPESLEYETQEGG